MITFTKLSPVSMRLRSTFSNQLKTAQRSTALFESTDIVLGAT
jgi:hypothetical protein